jgi:hypothetical protein
MRRTLLTIVAALALLSGCAGDKDKGDGVATAGDATSSASAAADTGGDDAAKAAKFAQCMRDNGVDMPDPTVDGGKVTFGGPAEADGQPLDREKVNAAQQKCKQYLPNGGEPPQVSAEDLEKMRKFSQCMRENGYPDFPDPQPDGGIRIDGDQTGSMNPDSEEWKAAHKKCEQYMPARPGGAQGQTTDGGS